MRRRYGIDWYAGGRWYSIGRTWWTKWGALRACRRVLRAARCGAAARVVIVLSPVAARTSAGRPATWSGPGGGAPGASSVADRRHPPASSPTNTGSTQRYGTWRDAFTAARAWVGARR